MKVLNLYACLGGNRLLWDDCEVTAVELDPELARLYQERFPNDTVIVGDAHQYLLDHHKEYDFIWSSPPCQSHSRTNYFTQAIRKRQVFPSMELYEEIIFLQHFSECKWVVENVIPYYETLVPATKIGRHLFWSNFVIPVIPQPKGEIGTMMKEYVGTGKHAHDKSLAERNAVNSELGKHIFDIARGIYNHYNNEQQRLF
jgi:DNA (cytosine-5)-methyltransferase 1